jgi:beta-lactamase regulating signal transducer with metallopeptidase domain
MNGMSWFGGADYVWQLLDVLIEPLGWTLIHSLWQFGLLAVVYASIRSIQRGSSAQSRYLTSCVALALLPVIAGWTLSSQFQQEPELPGAVGTQAASTVLGESAPPAPTAALASGISTTGHQGRPERLERLAGWSRCLQDRMAWLAMGWCCGVILASLRPLLGWRTVERLRRVGIAPVSEQVSGFVQRAAAEWNLRTRVGVMQSVLVDVPVVIGWLRPLILLPTSLLTGLTARELETLLLHELAHVRRHDALVNLIQTLVEAVFFYHPAVWWISRQIRHDREDCCDDMVVLMHQDRLEYARALVKLAEYQWISASAALSAGGGSLAARVHRIMLAPSDDRDRGPRLLMSLATLVLSGLCVSCLSLRETRGVSQIAPRPGALTVSATGTVSGPFPYTIRSAPESLPVEEVPSDWVRFDPLPALGFVDSAGPGWQFLRIATSPQFVRESRLAPEKVSALKHILDAYLHWDRELEQELRAAGRFDKDTWTTRRSERWLVAQALAEDLIGDELARRVQELMIQRAGYRGFRDERLAVELELSGEQQTQIDSIIRSHSAFVAANQARLKRAAQQAASTPSGSREDLPALRKELTKSGVESHMRVWERIYVVLTSEQRRQYDLLRGSVLLAAERSRS